LWGALRGAQVEWLGADPVDIALSTDDGATWTTLVTSVGGQSSNAIAVAVPDAPTTVARIRVSISGQPITPENSDVSALPFEIRLYVNLTVAPDGTGDVATIQEAIDRTVPGYGGLDTLTVLPGYYDEVIEIPLTPCCPSWVLAPAGPFVTRVRGMVRAALATAAGLAPEPDPEVMVPGPTIYFNGLAVAEPVSLPGSLSRVEFRACRFEGEFTIQGGNFPGPILVDSDFLARTQLIRVTRSILGCRFTSAPLYVESGNSNFLTLEDCSFTGPVDTAVVASSVGDAFVRFTNCSFDDADFGIVPITNGHESTIVERCHFTDIGDIAIDWNDTFSVQPFRLVVTDSKFTRCGRGIRWGPGSRQRVTLLADTLIDGTGTAIEVGHESLSLMEAVMVMGGDGDGIRIELPQMSGPLQTSMTLRKCAVSGNDGIGLRIVQLDDAVIGGAVLLEHSTIAHNGGTALSVRAGRFRAADNVLLQNDGHGIDASMVGDTPGLVIERNTVLGNLGDGIRATTAGPAALGLLRNNLASLNGGGGFSVGAGFAGSFASNDAWANYADPYTGPFSPDSNLVADPVFCDLVAGDLMVSSVSPCAPTGPYGQIGALGVGCNRLADVTPTGGVNGPAVTPNPARGQVSLSAPWPGVASTTEIFDLQGRRVWSGASAVGQSSLSWDGSREAGGRCAPGLYLVRFSYASETQYARLVWLE
jgi:hypothetical protein